MRNKPMDVEYSSAFKRQVKRLARRYLIPVTVYLIGNKRRLQELLN